MRRAVIGIDISKSTIYATIVFLEEQQNYHDSFLNKVLGFKQLLQWVKEECKTEGLLFCIQNTGHYARNVTILRRITINIPY